MKASKAFGSPAVKAVVTGALCAALLAGCAGAPVAKVDGTAHGQGQTTSEEVASASDANQSQTTAPSANVVCRPVAIVEMGFMSNPTEDQLLANPDYQYKQAVGMANGIDAYFGR